MCAHQKSRARKMHREASADSGIGLLAVAVLPQAVCALRCVRCVSGEQGSRPPRKALYMNSDTSTWTWTWTWINNVPLLSNTGHR